MLTILNNGQIVEWSYCRRLLKKAKKRLLLNVDSLNHYQDQTSY